MFKPICLNRNSRHTLKAIINICTNRDLSPTVLASGTRNMSFQQDYNFTFPTRVPITSDEQLVPKFVSKPGVTFIEPYAVPIVDNKSWFDHKVKRERSARQDTPPKKTLGSYDLQINMSSFSPAEIKIYQVPGHRIEVIGKQNGSEIIARYMVPFEYEIGKLKSQFYEGFLLIRVPKVKGAVDYASAEIERNKRYAIKDNFFMKPDLKPQFIEVMSSGSHN